MVLIKRRISKRKKSAWRSTNISDVEKFLEDERFKQRTGIDFDTQPDDSFFTIDATPSTQVKEKTDEPLTSRQKRKLKLLQKEPTCFKTLRSYSAVEVPTIPRQVKTKVGLRKKKKEEKPKVDVKVEDGTTSTNAFNEFNAIVNKDIWWDALPSKPKNKNKKKTLPAIEPPHPGLSYNPSLKDHQELLHEIGKEELEVMKKQEHLNRVTKKLLTKVPAKDLEKRWMKEMSSGLFDKPEKPGKNENNDVTSINPPVKNRKKLPKQKKKRLEAKKREHLLELKKQEKKKVVDIYKLRFIKTSIEKTAEKQAKTREKREVAKKANSLKPKRIARKKFEENEINFNMAKDIRGSLRTIRAEGNPLADRYNSMQKRNILEPSEMVVRRMAKVKRYVRPGIELPGKIVKKVNNRSGRKGRK